MDILEKFSRGAANHTYQRIDPEYLVNIFLGYNDVGQMSMVITEYGNSVPVKSSKSINVSMKKRADGRQALAFDLLDGHYKSLFAIFCKDIIVCCNNAGPAMAISNALTRWKYWRELFGNKKQTTLDVMAIRGLIGELIELRDHFIKLYGAEKAVQAWMGPLFGHKDFEINDTWYEVKTVGENAVQVSISSLEQLESEIDGHLVIIRLEDTSNVNEFAINLNQIVLSVMDMLEDPTTIELFRARLDNMGYSCDPEYDKFCFMYKGVTRYSVNDRFPRLCRSNVPVAIGNAKYSIVISGIKEFQEGAL